MRKKADKIKSKAISMQDFFKAVVRGLKKKMAVEALSFLMADGKNHGFATEYSTDGVKIRLTKKELQILCWVGKKEIIFPKSEFRSKEQAVVKRSLLAKIRWKIWRHKICAIMPIYLEGRLVCLVLFRDDLEKSLMGQEYNYAKKIRAEMQYYLASILLYNQALDRVMRKIEA